MRKVFKAITKELDPRRDFEQRAPVFIDPNASFEERKKATFHNILTLAEVGIKGLRGGVIGACVDMNQYHLRHSRRLAEERSKNSDPHP